ncbi:transporter [Ideonella sp.]|uniref:transporter n=1 Tax=Ideonella sp. TaxID=1929293 RepID=UPI0035AFF91E
MMTPFPIRAAAMAALVALSASAAQASCGAASCNLLNDRFALGTWDHAGWSVDLRLESVVQDQLRRGSQNISPDDLPEDEEAVERHTRNLNLVTTLDYAVSPQWAFSLRLPLLQRDHAHDLIDEGSGELGAHERWRYNRVGDVQALVRWQAPAASGDDLAWALTGGLKLPTGSRSVANGDGSVAERSLQPGSGTTDLIVGASARFVLGLADALNLQATWTGALAERDGYKPGQRLDLSAGWAHAMSPLWSLLLQANWSQRGRDHGVEAEPALSGGHTLNLSPGVSLSPGHDDMVYALLQVPVSQQVNGIQLVPRTSLALGWTRAF